MQIDSLIGVGPLRFGMSRDAVRDRLQEVPRTIVKNPGRPPIEQFPRSGLQAHYDEEGKLELVEFYPYASVTFGGVQLLGGRKMIDVRRDLMAIGASGMDDGLGDIRYDDHGFSLFVEGDEVGSVGVFGGASKK